MRIARQDSLFELLLGRDVRKVSQVCVQHDRTDHLHDIRSLRAGGILRGSGTIVLCTFAWANTLENAPKQPAPQRRRRGKEQRQLKRED